MVTATTRLCVQNSIRAPPFVGTEWRFSFANTGTPNRQALDLSDGENSLNKLDLMSKFPYKL